jgi:hypothetical protein
MAKAPSGKASPGRTGAARKPAAPGKTAAPRKSSAPRARSAAPPPPAGGWLSGFRGRGPSWLAVAVIVLAVLVILPVAAAVIGDIWAVILAVLVGGFALGRATSR